MSNAPLTTGDLTTRAYDGREVRTPHRYHEPYSSQAIRHRREVRQYLALTLTNHLTWGADDTRGR